MELVELATLLWASVWAWRTFVRLGHGDRNSILIVYLVFYLEYVIPLGIDIIYGTPSYSQQPGFAFASQDLYVRFIYCVFVFIVPLIWTWKTKQIGRTQHTPAPQWIRMPLRVGSFLPLYLMFVAPDPGLYLIYAGVMRANIGIDIVMFHIVVSMATMFAVFCVACRCLIEPLRRQAVLEIVIAIIVSIWMNGKRYIVAESLMLVILALWYRGVVTGKKIIWTMFAGLCGLLVFSLSYQYCVRDISFDNLSRESATDDVRIDYTRDSRVRMAIFSEMYPDRMRILDYRGQNLVYYATLLVPRTIWENKPYSYACYFTNAMLNIYPQNLGWGMTTGIFDETIADLGLIGILVGPLLVKWYCDIGDSAHGWNVHVLTCIIACLLMSVQLTAFLPLVVLWVLSYIKNKRIALWRDPYIVIDSYERSKCREMLPTYNLIGDGE